MSRFQKIFLATSLVVVGFGVAKFLGQPVLPTELIATHGSQPSALCLGVSLPADASSTAQAAGRVRLLPDSAAAHSGAPPMSAVPAVATAPSLGNVIAPIGMNEKTDSSLQRSSDFGPITSSPFASSDAPRARLRNEAPRAIGADPQSPTAIRRLPADGTNIDAYKVVDSKTVPPTSWPAPQLLNAGFVNNAATSPPAVPALYTAPASSMPALTDHQVSPPPWPAPEETQEPRTHIVADGDSLERLGSRYLSDPRRGREIYELNRDKLSSPDLLPIGVELKIPDRVAAASWPESGFTPNATNLRPNVDVGQTNLSPARPVASPQSIVPRAQLAAPVMVQ